MRWKRTLQLLDVHCEGEIGRVVTGGAPKIPGNTVAEQLHWMNTDPQGEALRRFLTLEPRGTPMGSVNLLLPPKHPDAHAAFVILQPDQAHASSGSNSICATTALLESGMVEMQEPETVIILETAAGLVKATATCRDGRCEKVKLTMVPSFVHELDVSIDTPEWGRVTMDISYGGIFYALVDVRQIGLTIYQLDSNLRASAVVGIVGAGGIGSTLANAFGRYDYDFALAIVMVIISAILISEAVSGYVRRRIW